MQILESLLRVAKNQRGESPVQVRDGAARWAQLQLRRPRSLGAARYRLILQTVAQAPLVFECIRGVVPGPSFGAGSQRSAQGMPTRRRLFPAHRTRRQWPWPM